MRNQYIWLLLSSIGILTATNIMCMKTKHKKESTTLLSAEQTTLATEKRAPMKSNAQELVEHAFWFNNPSTICPKDAYLCIYSPEKCRKDLERFFKKLFACTCIKKIKRKKS